MHGILRRALNFREVRSLQKSFYGKECLGSYDVVIVGGGIVGVATARELALRYPLVSIGLVEKESKLAAHQSGHNSGVIHAGIYYTPGSMKAKLCSSGMRMLYEYLDRNKIPYKKVGKLIIATDECEVERLERLMERGIANGVPDVRMIQSEDIKKIEPNAQGLKAIHSPHTGIVDYALVTKSFAQDFQKSKGEIILDFKVNEFLTDPNSSYPVQIKSENGKIINTSFVLCCAGLYADKLAMLTGGKQDPAVVPFRGEYLLLKPEKSKLIKGNIYPVPDPRFPFLGVHFTPRMDGSVWLGPNAVLAYRREGYNYTDISPSELMESLKYKGTKKLIRKYFTFGLQENMKSFFKSLQVKDLQRFVPDLKSSDVVSGPAGVRAQALSTNGELIEDFVFEGGDAENPRILHCRNAPSPAATSSMAIAEILVQKIAQTVFKNHH